MVGQIIIAHADGHLFLNEFRCRCALGRSGTVSAEQKQEGDGASPSGSWPLRRVFYRPDRLRRPQTALPVVPLKPSDGWCDDIQNPFYNRAITRPFADRHEPLWREDNVYDIIVELAHNVAPVRAGRGSAIFFHLAHDDYRPTQGCVAIGRSDMLHILSQADLGTSLQIIPQGVP